jgi:hypothetical protein
VKNQKEIAEATNPLYNEMITLIEEKKESYILKNTDMKQDWISTTMEK